MSIDFIGRDVMHQVIVRFIRAFLPKAKKPYNLKAVHQPELDIHGIASKAEVYNITTNPKVIEEGLMAGIELMYYLVADGFKIKTPLFNLKICIPGEYSGGETNLLEGVYPRARLQTSAEFRQYLKDKVKLVFDGVEDNEGFIAEALDEATGIVGQKMTKGNILTIQGHGLRIDSDKEHQKEAGLFFTSPAGTSIKASIIPVNEPRKLKVLVPTELKAGTSYTLTIGTMSPVMGKGTLLRKMRNIKSGFTLTA